MIKAFVFDLDGVIIDSEPIHAEVGMHVLSDFGEKPSSSELYEFVGIRNEEMWAVLKKRHGIEATVEQLVSRHDFYKQKRFFHEKLEAIGGIPELIGSAKARGMKIALATSSPRYFAEHVLKNVGLLAYFDALITSDDIRKGKPDPEIYRKAAEALGVRADECVVLEDAFFGIRSAKGAGMKCIAFINPHSGHQDTTEADFVVSSIRDIDLNSLENL